MIGLFLFFFCSDRRHAVSLDRDLVARGLVRCCVGRGGIVWQVFGQDVIVSTQSATGSLIENRINLVRMKDWSICSRSASVVVAQCHSPYVIMDWECMFHGVLLSLMDFATSFCHWYRGVFRTTGPFGRNTRFYPRTCSHLSTAFACKS